MGNMGKKTQEGWLRVEMTKSIPCAFKVFGTLAVNFLAVNPPLEGCFSGSCNPGFLVLLSDSGTPNCVVALVQPNVPALGGGAEEAGMLPLVP